MEGYTEEEITKGAEELNISFDEYIKKYKLKKSEDDGLWYDNDVVDMEMNLEEVVVSPKENVSEEEEEEEEEDKDEDEIVKTSTTTTDASVVEDKASDLESQSGKLLLESFGLGTPNKLPDNTYSIIIEDFKEIDKINIKNAKNVPEEIAEKDKLIAKNKEKAFEAWKSGADEETIRSLLPTSTYDLDLNIDPATGEEIGLLEGFKRTTSNIYNNSQATAKDIRRSIEQALFSSTIIPKKWYDAFLSSDIGIFDKTNVVFPEPDKDGMIDMSLGVEVYTDTNEEVGSAIAERGKQQFLEAQEIRKKRKYVAPPLTGETGKISGLGVVSAMGDVASTVVPTVVASIIAGRVFGPKAAKATAQALITSQIFPNMWGTYNEQKAASLYPSLSAGDGWKKLIKEEKIEFAIPAGLSVFSVYLQSFGFSGIMKGLFSKPWVYGKIIPTIWSVGKTSGTETVTEVLELIPQGLNEGLGKQLKGSELGFYAWDYFSNNAAETAAQSLFGTFGLTSLGKGSIQAAKVISEHKPQHTQGTIGNSMISIGILKQKLEFSTDKNVKDAIKSKINNLENYVKSQVGKGEETVLKLTDEQIDAVNKAALNNQEIQFKIKQVNEAAQKGEITRDEQSITIKEFGQQYRVNLDIINNIIELSDNQNVIRDKNGEVTNEYVKTENKRIAENNDKNTNIVLNPDSTSREIDKAKTELTKDNQGIVNKLINKSFDPNLDTNLTLEEFTLDLGAEVQNLINSYGKNRDGSLKPMSDVAPFGIYLRDNLPFRLPAIFDKQIQTTPDGDFVPKVNLDEAKEEITEEEEENKKEKNIEVKDKKPLIDVLPLPENLQKEIERVVTNIYSKSKIPKIGTKDFDKKVNGIIKNELKPLMSKFIGKKSTGEYENFLRNNFEYIYPNIPKSIINKRFPNFKDPVLDEDGKQIREKTPQGNAVINKRSIAKAEWIKWFLGAEVGISTQGTRKDALAETLAIIYSNEISLNVLNDPKVKKDFDIIQDLKPKNAVEKIGTLIDYLESKYGKKSGNLYAGPIGVAVDVLIGALKVAKASIEKGVDATKALKKAINSFNNNKDVRKAVGKVNQIKLAKNINAKINSVDASPLEIENAIKNIIKNKKSETPLDRKQLLSTLKTAFKISGVVIPKKYDAKTFINIEKAITNAYQNEFEGRKPEPGSVAEFIAREILINANLQPYGKTKNEIKGISNTSGPDLQFINDQGDIIDVEIKRDLNNIILGSGGVTVYADGKITKKPGLDQSIFDMIKPLIESNIQKYIDFIKASGSKSTDLNNISDKIRNKNKERGLQKALNINGEIPIQDAMKKYKEGNNSFIFFVESNEVFSVDTSTNNIAPTLEGLDVKGNIRFKFAGRGGKIVSAGNLSVDTEIIKNKTNKPDKTGVPAAGFVKNINNKALLNINAAKRIAAIENNDKLPSKDKLKNNPSVEETIDNAIKIFEENNKKIIDESKDSNLDKEFNDLLQDTEGLRSETRFSPVKGQVMGADKGRFKFFLPPSAEDFLGLLYTTLGKNKVGDSQLSWYKNNLLDPYSKGLNNLNVAKLNLMNQFNTLKNKLNIVPKDLRKKLPDSFFTREQAVRVYIWSEQGMDIPGLTASDLKKLNSYVAANKDLTVFAEELIQLNKGDGYVGPKNFWTSGTIDTDLLEGINTVMRAKYLEQWQTNVDIIFSESNLNKLEALYGKKYRDALEGTLQRMKTGRNRTFGTDDLTGRLTDWLTNSVGAIMFFNTRSAILQTLSSINFINWTDNNPLKAAAALANIPQYSKDFIKLINSPFLLARRDGLKINVNEADIADMAKTPGNMAKKFIAKTLRLGFLPTQLADSFAIASGGATFYRNRIKSLIKQGMTEQQAEDQAMLDFIETSETSQQSSRPDKISEQQAGPLGRIILAFANTPMQYTREIKKAALDLKNNRGDAKTNISKIIYYGIAQNLLFNVMQQALFALAFGDEDEELTEKARASKHQKYYDILNSMSDQFLRGSGVGGAVASTLKNTIIKLIKENKKNSPKFNEVLIKELVQLSPPIGSKIRKLDAAGRSFSWNRKEMKEEGFSLDNPAYLATANLISASTNVPLDRIIKKIDNLRNAANQDLQTWQRIASLGGWSKWQLGIDNKPNVELTKEQSLIKLNKKEQIDLLKKLKVSDSIIKTLKYEKDRVEYLLKKEK